MALTPEEWKEIQGNWQTPEGGFDHSAFGILADRLEDEGLPQSAALRSPEEFGRHFLHYSDLIDPQPTATAEDRQRWQRQVTDEARQIFSGKATHRPHRTVGKFINELPTTDYSSLHTPEQQIKKSAPTPRDTQMPHEEPIKTEEPKVKYSRGEKGKPVWSVDPALRGKDATAEDKKKDLKATIKEGEKEPEEPVQKAFGVTKTLHHSPSGPGAGGVVQRPGPMALHQAVGDLLHHAPAGMSTRNPRDQTLQNHLYGMAEKAGASGLKGKSGAMYHVKKWRPREDHNAPEPELNLSKYDRSR